jgi:hypothetical protein
MTRRKNEPSVEEKRAEIRALKTLLGELGQEPTLMDAMLEAVLKQQEGRELGVVEIREQALVAFLDVLPVRREAVEQTTTEPVLSAYLELARDTKLLYDPGEDGYVGAAVYVDLARDNTGASSINVALKNIDGAQVAFVLDVARRYELEASEENGYLNLRPHLVFVEETDGEREPEAVEA